MKREIIDNRVGEPDLNFIPPHLRVGQLPKMLHTLIEYGYSLDRRGMHETLHAVAVDFNAKNNSDITEENIVLASGARAAASSAILHVKRKFNLANPRVLLMQPGYNLYEEQFEGFGYTIDYINLLGEGERLELLRKNITPETLFLPICNPNNPTGEVYSENFLRGVLKLVDEFPNLHVINDSIYDRIVRDANMHPPNIFALASPQQQKKVFEINALSKFYSYPAIRAGWLISDPVEIAAIQQTKDAQFGPLNNIAQLLIIAALEMTPKLIPDYFAQVNDVYNARLKMVHEKLHQIKGFEGEIPAGAFYYWAGFSGTGVKAADIVSELHERGIEVSGGAKYGAADYIRINCGARAAELAVICDEVLAVCKERRAEVAQKLVRVPAENDDLPKFARGVER